MLWRKLHEMQTYNVYEINTISLEHGFVEIQNEKHTCLWKLS
jgi:hypothetical protein